MNNLNIFISVGTANDYQETFVKSITERLKSDFNPKIVGKNTFGMLTPLKTIMKLMDDCCGAIIIGLERTYLIDGVSKRGGNEESFLKNIKYSTPWNQIEAAIAYCKGLPLMIILEDGLQYEGLLTTGFDWYVMRLNSQSAFLTSDEFIQVYSEWKDSVQAYSKKKENSSQEKTQNINPAELTIGDLIKGLKPAHLWGIIAALLSLVVGAFAFGAKLV